MAIDIDHALELIREDLAPLKISVELVFEEHVYYISFASDERLRTKNYWQEYWGMDFVHVVKLWVIRYFKRAEVYQASEHTAKFRLGSLLDFIKNTEHDI